MYVCTYTVGSIYSPWYVASPFGIRQLAKQSKQSWKFENTASAEILKNAEARNDMWSDEIGMQNELFFPSAMMVFSSSS